MFAPLRELKYKAEHDEMELEPESSLQLTTIPQRYDDEAKNLTNVFPLVLRNERIIYSLVVFKYRYKGMSEGMVRITENCGWFAGDPGTLAWRNCWNRTYDIRQSD